ncbi:hypothetical protein CWE12_07135 [Aliidiomarina sedimenti]|uniref:Lipoprotein n=1 Tax=Aliidiomarina sedimenti TaxID=1933879 RepID=A0ABY0BYG7_9GAMM|nr:hypothetical protein [Aliidiomarina sedimenti]RUO29738.1 hypothetical protein CWE12_07135 [Aliidiomarina sedimenti]
MIKKAIMVLSAAVILSGCSSTGVSWKTFKNDDVDAGYCSATFVEPADVNACEVEYVALQRAKTECEKDVNPDYCVLMAENGWDNFKDMVLTVEPTKEHAESYPVMCRSEDDSLKSCSEL